MGFMVTEEIISKGVHYLSGICEIQYNDEYGDYCGEGILLTIDNENYAIFTDPTDGWRSYGCMVKTNRYKQTNSFPKQRVIVSFDEEDCIKILNEDNELIVKIGTDYSWDSYYPCAIFEYNPQNLPINKEKKKTLKVKMQCFITILYILRTMSFTEKKYI